MAIMTEIHAGHTFARVAMTSRFSDKRARNTANAQKAYDTARRWTRETALSSEESKEIAEQLELLETDLAKLKKHSKT